MIVSNSGSHTGVRRRSGVGSDSRGGSGRCDVGGDWRSRVGVDGDDRVGQQHGHYQKNKITRERLW